MPCLVSGGGFLYLTDSHLHSVPQVFINDWRDNIFCPVVMVLIDSDVFLITENLSESVLEGMAEFYSAELSQKINRGMRESAMKHNSIGGAIPLG